MISTLKPHKNIYDHIYFGVCMRFFSPHIWEVCVLKEKYAQLTQSADQTLSLCNKRE